jgi:hypothetical protein
MLRPRFQISVKIGLRMDQAWSVFLLTERSFVQPIGVLTLAIRSVFN